MSDLRTRVIRLAHENPSLRPHLLPLLKEAASPAMALARQLGIPSSGSELVGSNKVVFNRKGPAALKVFAAVEQAIMDAGWKRTVADSFSVPDGSSTGKSSAWRDSAGNRITLDKTVGSTAAGNRVEIELIVA